MYLFSVFESTAFIIVQSSNNGSEKHYSDDLAVSKPYDLLEPTVCS